MLVKELLRMLFDCDEESTVFFSIGKPLGDETLIVSIDYLEEMDLDNNGKQMPIIILSTAEEVPKQHEILLN